MLSLHAPEQEAYEAAETLGFLDETEALALSVYEKRNIFIVEALYEHKDDAETAQMNVGGEISTVPEKNWVAETQSGLPPVEAGRFFVHGSHDSDKIPETVKHPILIDAGMAFGTGHHGTTKGCLVILDTLISEGYTPNTVLDLGCGAGILAIAAAKSFPAKTIIATDIDRDAVDVTDQNTAINEVSQNVEAFQADGFDSDALTGKSFDLIFANILAGPLMGLAPEIFLASAIEGKVILSGILNEQADQVVNKFNEAGFSTEAVITLGEWTSLLATKPA